MNVPFCDFVHGWIEVKEGVDTNIEQIQHCQQDNIAEKLVPFFQDIFFCLILWRHIDDYQFHSHQLPEENHHGQLVYHHIDDVSDVPPYTFSLRCIVFNGVGNRQGDHGE